MREAPIDKTLVIACEIMEDETLLALEQAYGTGPRPAVVWFESGLHDRPERLQAALRELIATLDEGARENRPVSVSSIDPRTEGSLEDRRFSVEVGPLTHVLFAMGYCGGGLKDLTSSELHLVFPRVDDCISLFLNPGCVREEIERDHHSYYVTKGWFCHASSFNDGFEAWVERYGLEKAVQLRRLMYASYERVTLIDTGAYEVKDWLGRSREYADELELDHRLVTGYITLLLRLFEGPWDSEIVAVPPGETIQATSLLER